MRASVSVLESFRKFAREEDSFVTLEQLLDTIAGKYRAGWQAQAGGAFHAAVETSPEPDADGMVTAAAQDGPPWAFRAEDVRKVQDVVPRLAEVDLALPVETSRGVLTVSMRVDAAEGRVIHELKTKWGWSFEFGEWFESFQWRWYALSGASEVRYHVADMKADEQERSAVMTNLHTFSLFPYPNMAADCRGLAEEFLEFVYANGLSLKA